jgi:Uma2 family endonuclease
LESLRERDSSLALGAVFFEMGYLLTDGPRSWLQPDVSITRAAQTGERYYEGAPMTAFEIVSEFDTARQIHGKVKAYLAHGAEEVWVIYPDDRNAWVYSKSSARLETRAVTSALLPGIEILFDAFL